VANESRTSDSKATRPGQIGMAATCGNGYVFDKLLKKKKIGDRPQTLPRSGRWDRHWSCNVRPRPGVGWVCVCAEFNCSILLRPFGLYCQRC